MRMCILGGWRCGVERFSWFISLPTAEKNNEKSEVGEDGPTHQPIETIPSLRLIPDLTVMRPADGNETAGAYK